MAMRWGPGPVFVFDWLMISRRWQVYAVRSLFVLALLVNLSVVWLADVSGRAFVSWRQLAEVGQIFFVAIVGTQLALVLLAAPVATAGSFSTERTRGTLAHMLVTDLSSAEIVLGKLFARLLPIVAMVACSLPVLALSSLLGGIDPLALWGAFLVTLGVGLVGCSFALCLSVWARNVVEVLLATYAVFIVWILAYPLWVGCRMILSGGFFAAPLPLWVAYANPFWLALQPYIPPGAIPILPSIPVSLADDFAFLAGASAVAACFALVTIWGIRRAGLRHANRAAKARREARSWRRLLPSPSLDGNPVLWREWHRRRPSRWIRIVWGVYACLTSLFCAPVLFRLCFEPDLYAAARFAPVLNAFAVAAGLMLVSVTAAASLAEERASGSLDVLLATPLPTSAIVWGKWWGAFRSVLWLAIWPGLLGFAMFLRRPSRGAFFLLLVGQLLAQGGALVSLGLLAATWIRRLERALAVTVAAYVLVTVGWVFFALVLAFRNDNLGIPLAIASPFFGALFSSLPLALPEHAHPVRLLFACGAWMTAYLVAALLLYGTTLATFDRATGRMSERRRPTSGRLLAPDH